jgi:protein-L-isoaspartate O-methyltransferase
MRALNKLLAALLLAALASPAAAQSLGEIARESKKKKAESTRKVWTNDELGTAFPPIKFLGKTGSLPSLGLFDPTPLPVVEAMLRLAGVQPGEVVFDLGSGDGRIVILAAEKFGARGVGIEIDEKLVAESLRAVEAKGLADKVKILHANAFDVDLRPADVVTLYVAPTTMNLLRQHMEATLRLGTRVVSHKFEVTGWVPDRMVEAEGYFVYLYTVKK